MLRFPSKGAVLLVLALALSSLQCVALCAGKTCLTQDAQKLVPPCHKGQTVPTKSLPAGCGHELILDDTAQAPIVHVSTSDTSVAAILPINSTLIAMLSVEANGPTFSPPGLTAVALTVLRI